MYVGGVRLEGRHLDEAAEREVTRYLLRDPRVAAGLSALVMGLGQLFNAQYKRAFVFFGGELAVFLYLFDFSKGLPVSQTLSGLTSPWIYQGFLGLLMFGGTALWAYNVWDAYRMAEFCRFIYDRDLPLLDADESEIIARHLTINRAGLSFHRGLSRTAVFAITGLVLYSAALVALGAFFLGRRDTARIVAAGQPRPTAPNPADARGLLKAGEAALDAGDSAAAEKHFGAVLALDPEPRLRYQALVDLGRVSSTRGDDAKASERLLEAVTLAKQIAATQAPSTESPIGRAGSALSRGDALTAEKLLAPVSGDAQSWLPLGRAALARGDSARAQKLLADYVAAPIAEPIGWLELARAELKLGRHADAAAHAERFLKLVPADVDGVLVWAEALEAARGPSPAYRAIESAMSAHPNDPRLLDEAMQLAEGMGNTDQALQTARALLKVSPENARARAIVKLGSAGASAPEAPAARDGKDGPIRVVAPPVETTKLSKDGAELYREGSTRPPPGGVSAERPRGDVSVDRYADLLREAELAFSSGDFDRALAQYDRVLKVRPDHPRSLFQKGILLRQRKDRPGAIRALEAAVKVRPADVPALGELGQLYLESSQDEKAYDTFTQVVKLDARNLAARYSLAELLEKREDLRAAEEQYRSIVRHYPELADAYQYLGNLYFRQNRLPESLDQFQKFLGIHGDDPAVRYKIGLIYYRQNRPERALEHFRAARDQIQPAKDGLYPKVQKYMALLEKGAAR